ncbi:hypothetical protein GALMADRAFT_216665 [Galerina marginata CBS 339.88]|uniref:Uncharacterized protein n=1 Tax=Galerina marginata (strain CBS 339.88) TaxID=685588 RepID=A0A067S8Q5_GALM3|nr:hypothetical protein GALMADRAFT_216665 [Galerina marginata CBS 339.88]
MYALEVRPTIRTTTREHGRQLKLLTTHNADTDDEHDIEFTAPEIHQEDDDDDDEGSCPREGVAEDPNQDEKPADLLQHQTRRTHYQQADTKSLQRHLQALQEEVNREVEVCLGNRLGLEFEGEDEYNVGAVEPEKGQNRKRRLLCEDVRRKKVALTTTLDNLRDQIKFQSKNLRVRV